MKEAEKSLTKRVLIIIMKKKNQENQENRVYQENRVLNDIEDQTYPYLT